MPTGILMRLLNERLRVYSYEVIMSAHSKFTNEVGVCLATSGPRAIHLLNGLYD